MSSDQFEFSSKEIESYKAISPIRDNKEVEEIKGKV